MSITSQSPNISPTNLDSRTKAMSTISKQFPDLDAMQLNDDEFPTSKLLQLAKLNTYSVPVCKYPPEMLKFYKMLSNYYWDQLLSIAEKQRCVQQPQVSSIVPYENVQNSQVGTEKSINAVLKETIQRRAYNYIELLGFVKSCAESHHYNVSEQLEQSVYEVVNWEYQDVRAQLKVNCKNKNTYFESYQFKKSSKQASKLELETRKSYTPKPIIQQKPITIILGRNISDNVRKIKEQITDRAKSSTFVKDDANLQEQSRRDNNINYILNLITTTHFDFFFEEIGYYVLESQGCMSVATKLIVKAQEGHNFIDLYCKLAKELCRIHRGRFEFTKSEKFNEFQLCLVRQLQNTFETLVNQPDLTRPEEQRKKFLTGVVLFICGLLNNKVLMKRVFKKCFLTLILAFIRGYQTKEHNDFFHELYFELVLIIIEKASTICEKVSVEPKKTQSIRISSQLLQLSNEDRDSYCLPNCDYLGVLTQLNSKLPSIRYKLTFLLHDYNCRKQLKRSQTALEQENEINQLINLEETTPEELQKIDSSHFLKCYFSSLTKNNSTSIDKKLKLLRKMCGRPQFSCYFLDEYKHHFEKFMIISSDYPYLQTSIARSIHEVCVEGQLTFELFKINSSDEDIVDFMAVVERRYKFLFGQQQ